MPTITAYGTLQKDRRSYNSNTTWENPNNITDQDDTTYCKITKPSGFLMNKSNDSYTRVKIGNFDFSNLPAGAIINNLTLSIHFYFIKNTCYIYIKDARLYENGIEKTRKGSSQSDYISFASGPTVGSGEKTINFNGIDDITGENYFGTWTRDELLYNDPTTLNGFVIEICPSASGSLDSNSTIYIYSVKLTVDYSLASHTISTAASPANTGSVTGAGTYPDGTAVSLAATPNSGYKFVQWQDGDTTNPRTITASQDITYIATFAPDSYTISTVISPSGAGTVTGGGTYNAGSSVTLTATPAIGYKFSKWSDNNTNNPRTITASSNATYTAIFESSSQIYVGTTKIQKIYLGTTPIKKIFIGTKQIY